MVRIVSQNVRGLGDKIKCKEVFYYLRNKGNIIFIQETHSLENIEDFFGNMNGEERFIGDMELYLQEEWLY